MIEFINNIFSSKMRKEEREEVVLKKDKENLSKADEEYDNKVSEMMKDFQVGCVYKFLGVEMAFKGSRIGFVPDFSKNRMSYIFSGPNLVFEFEFYNGREFKIKEFEYKELSYLKAVIRKVETGEEMLTTGRGSNNMKVSYTAGMSSTADSMKLDEVCDRVSDRLMQEMLDSKVDILNLSVRASNCIKDSMIFTIRELISKTESDLLSRKQFGKKSVNEIKIALKELGLELKK